MEEEDVLKEAFFSPSDGEGATLQALFDAFSKAAELNPEPGEEAGEEPQGEGELVFDHGRCAYARWCSLATWSSFFLSVDARFVFLCTHGIERRCALSSYHPHPVFHGTRWFWFYVLRLDRSFSRALAANTAMLAMLLTIIAVARPQRRDVGRLDAVVSGMCQPPDARTPLLP